MLAVGVYLTHDYYQRRVLVGYDLRDLWLPTWTFLGHSLAGGHVPLWDPHVLSGRPFAADPQSGWLYLMPMALFTALPAHVAIRLMVVLPPILAALALYAFCRIEGLPRIAGFCGGAALLGLTTPDAVLLRSPFESTLLYAMTTLACAAWLLHARRPLTRACAVAALGISYSQAISAHLSIGLLEVTMLLGAYLAVKAVPGLRRRTLRGLLRTACLAAGAALAVALICAGPLLPRLALVPHTNLAHGYDAVWRAGLELAGLHPGQMPVQQAARFASWPLWLFVDSGAQLPLAAGLLVVIGLLSRRHGLALAFAAVGLAAYLLTLRSFALAVPASWDRFTVVDFYRHGADWFAYLSYAAMALMTALGAERVVGWLRGGSVRTRAAVVVSGLMAAAIGVQLVLGLPDRSAPPGVPEAMERPQAVDANPVGDPGQPGFQSRFRGTGRVAVLYRADEGFDLYTKAFPAPASTTFDLADVTGADSVSGYDAVQLEPYWHAIRLYDHAQLPYDRTGLTHLTPSMADLLDVGWWVAPVSQAAPPGARLVETHLQGQLWRLQPPGLASLYPSWQAAPGENAAQARAVAPGFHPLATVVVPGLAGGGVKGPRRPVRARVSAPGTVTVTTHAARPSLLLVRDAYDPGWHATVDGRPARVYPADGFLLGVQVPAGRDRVVLSYSDPLVFWGLWISVGAIAALLIGGAAADRGAGRIWGRRPTH